MTAAAKVTPNQTGVNSLLVFDMPVEFGWKLGELPMRVFGDFAINFDGDDRAAAAGHPDKGDQRYAYQIGLGAGKLKTRSDWQLSAFYQHIEQFALDPNLVDSDFFDTRVNMEGFVVQGGYALSDADLLQPHLWLRPAGRPQPWDRRSGRCLQSQSPAQIQYLSDRPEREVLTAD